MPKVQDLTTEFITAALLYRMIEKEDAIPLVLTKTDLEFVENEMNALAAIGAVEPNSDENTWDVTDKGEEIFDRLLDTFEALIDLDIFAGVNLSLDLADELFDEDGLILEDKLDPRFDEPVSEEEADALGTTDLRLAILDYLAEKTAKKLHKPYTGKIRHDMLSRVVFIQELGNDKFVDDKAFFDLKLGGIAAEINTIVSSLPVWMELAKEFDPPSKLMDMIIEAGFHDAKKREMLEGDNESVWLDVQKQSKVLQVLMEPLVS